MHNNTITGSTATGAAISFAANNATLKLCDDVKIFQNTVATELNAFSAIAVSGVSTAKNTNVKIYGNIINGDNSSQTSRYAININNTTGLEVYQNEFNGPDLGYTITNCTGVGYDNTFRVLRDCYGAVDNSTFYIRDKFKDIPRRCVLAQNGTVLTLDVEIDTATAGLYVFDNAGAFPACTIFIDRLVCKGVNTHIIYADTTNAQKIVFNSQPAQISTFISNVVQSSWNITQAPSTGSWTVGQEWYSLTPVVGQPLGGVCTVSGTPGTWVSRANL